MRLRLPLALVASAGLLSACGAPHVPSDSGSFLPAATTSAPTTAATTAPPTTASGGTKVGPALAAALDTLSARIRSMPALDPARAAVKSGNDDVTRARTALQSLRTAAFGATKSCTVVLQQRGVVYAQTNAALGQASVLDQQVGLQRGGIAALQSAVAGVNAAVAGQHTSLAQLPDVAAALKSAASTISSATTSANGFAGNASTLRSNSASVSSTARDVSYKAC